jgi:tetratricopeptide (TPR) repeat protein
MDYYLASIRPSCEYLIENEISKNPDKKYEILTYGMDQVKYYFRNQPNVHIGYTRFDDRSEKKWDYAIFYNAYMDKARLDNGSFPPAGTIFTPEVDGKPMGCVVKRISDLDYQGIQAITKENNQDKGITLLNEYLKVDPKSTEALFYIGNAYANKGNVDSALIYMNRCLALFPEYSRALFSAYQMYVEKDKYDLAVNTMQAYIGSRPKDPEGYSMKAQAHLLNKDYDLAIASIKEAVKINPLDARSYQIGAQCFKLKNDQTNFNKWVGAMSYGNVKTQQEFTNAQFYIDEIYQEITGEKVNWEKYFPQQ